MATSAIMNIHVKDNLDVLSSHAHSGAAGMGFATLSGNTFTAIATPQFADQSGSPSVAGRIQRNGNNLEYYNGSAVVGLYADGATGVATLRSLGTGSTQASAGDHTHS